MFKYTVRIFLSNVSRFVCVFSSIPRKLFTIFQPTFFPIKRYQDILFKLLTLSMNSVTKKVIVVHSIYFYNSGSIFATKNFVTESVRKVRSFMGIPGIIRSGENVGWKMVYNFLGKDEKTWRYLYLLKLRTSLWKRRRTFFLTVDPSKTHVTTHLGIVVAGHKVAFNNFSVIS